MQEWLLAQVAKQYASDLRGIRREIVCLHDLPVKYIDEERSADPSTGRLLSERSDDLARRMTTDLGPFFSLPSFQTHRLNASLDRADLNAWLAEIDRVMVALDRKHGANRRDSN
jgi:hypothetical protein